MGEWVAGKIWGRGEVMTSKKQVSAETETIPINETYALEEETFEEGEGRGYSRTEDVEIKPGKKMIVKATISYILWMGDQYRSAAISIDHCCQEAIDKYGEFSPQQTDVPRGQDPANFLKMIYQGRPIDNCPFCGAEIEIKVK